MAEIAATILAKQLAQVLTEIFAPTLVEKVKMLRDVREDVEQIIGYLETMQAALKDADQRQSREELAKVWVKQVRKVVFYAEDTMDEFMCRLGRSPARGLKGWLSFLHHMRTWYWIANRIHYIKRCIHNISETRIKLVLPSTFNNATSAASSSSYDPRLGAQYAEESQLVGIIKSKVEMTKRLIEGEERLEVIPVVGMPGVGKSTLVSHMYEDPAVTKHFPCRAYVTVSQKLDIIELLRSMTKQFIRWEKSSAQDSSSMSAEELVRILRAFLKGRKYVAIMDDLWAVDDWKMIESVFPENMSGSRVMVTTRSEAVAYHCAKRRESVFRLEPLSERDAWDLFCKKAFTSDFECRCRPEVTHECGCPDHLIQTAKNIVSKCGRLPLAIVTIGGLLKTKNETLMEWKSVYRCLGSELKENEKMMRVLSLSYDCLPSQLKPCFLYFGIYPSSYEVKSAELCRQWVAEGFISPQSGSTLEDVSYKNLMELAQRSLVQIVKKDCFGRVQTCQVHELMHTFILLKSSEQNFHTSVGLHGDARRLAIYSGQKFEGNIPVPSQLRSLFLFGPTDAPSLAKFRFLKLLCLHEIKLDSFPSSVVDLIHLKYLYLRRTNIKTIPKSIRKLHSLETLDLKYTAVSELPEEIIQLQGLRHLLVCDATSPLFGVKMPAELGNFISMQKLLLLDVLDGRNQILELGKLTQLRRLSITSLRSEDGIALCDSITKMRHIQSLAVSSGVPNESLDIHSLPTPSSDMRSIKFSGRLYKLPEWLLSLYSLVKLRLWHSWLEDDPFQALGGLPCLTDLRLFDDAYAGEELLAEAHGFAKLNKLYIGNFRVLKSIKLKEGTMPNLEFWAIRGCHQMKRLPIGIEHLNHLEEIQLHPELLSTLKEEQGEDWRKLKRIPILCQNFCVEGTWYWYNFN